MLVVARKPATTRLWRRSTGTILSSSTRRPMPAIWRSDVKPWMPFTISSSAMCSCWCLANSGLWYPNRLTTITSYTGNFLFFCGNKYGCLGLMDQKAVIHKGMIGWVIGVRNVLKEPMSYIHFWALNHLPLSFARHRGGFPIWFPHISMVTDGQKAVVFSTGLPETCKRPLTEERPAWQLLRSGQEEEQVQGEKKSSRWTGGF